MEMGIYIHWPFCESKCPYCDFNSHVSASIDFDSWQDSYLKELKTYYKKIGPKKVVSVFFGGGTPSLMEPRIISSILHEINKLWGIANDVEVTLEANPTSVELDKFKNFKSAGINRVSLGVQALEQDSLNFLGRKHNVKEAIRALEVAEKTFDRYSFDLIYARPEQTVKAWEKELEKALDLQASHLSLYQLTIEPGTPFYTQHNRGEFAVPEEGVSSDLYEITQSIMEDRKMPAYEISNHAVYGQECIHNLVYWKYRDYLGVGPGAHGRVTIKNEKFATRGHRAPEIWMNKVKKEGVGAHPFEKVSYKERFIEALMMGLRLTEGILLEDLNQQAGGNWKNFVNEKRLNQFIEDGLIVLDGKRIVATKEGRQRLNWVLAELL
jgi:oxygen-independent coproporphyrinogen-3 oxidase